MVTTHYKYFACSINVHAVTDDFGNLIDVIDLPPGKSTRAWWNAYRFANVVSFEQAGMHSINQAVSEH